MKGFSLRRDRALNKIENMREGEKIEKREEKNLSEICFSTNIFQTKSCTKIMNPSKKSLKKIILPM